MRSRRMRVVKIFLIVRSDYTTLTLNPSPFIKGEGIV